jgi:hypothetical protein
MSIFHDIAMDTRGRFGYENEKGEWEPLDEMINANEEPDPELFKENFTRILSYAAKQDEDDSEGND